MKKTITFSLKGGNLPSGFECKITATINYDGITESELIERVTSGQSDRVRLQSQLRKLKPARLNEISKTVYKIKWSEIGQGTVSDILLNMTAEQFYATVVHNWKFSRDEAIRVYSTKHNISLDEATEVFTDIN